MTVRRMLALGGCALLVSTGSYAQTLSDADYCQELASLVRMYQRGNSPNAATAAALNACDTGNFGVAIPRLEEILTGRKIPLPPRG